MTVIAIVGTSGVGKSFLTKQLASLKSCPAFFEGEEGTIPDKILQQVFATKNPIDRWKFFMHRYGKNLSNARQVSKLGMDCFVDGGIISAHAVLEYEPPEYRKTLYSFIKKFERLEADKIILLIADKKIIKKMMMQRRRGTEMNKEAMNRALKIQDAFIQLSKNYKNIIIIDRSKMDFSKEKDLEYVRKKAGI